MSVKSKCENKNNFPKYHHPFYGYHSLMIQIIIRKKNFNIYFVLNVKLSLMKVKNNISFVAIANYIL